MMRLRIHVAGIVQGVGFRPFVFRLSNQLGLSGWVKNDSGGICIEVEGSESNLAIFQESLARSAPRLAVIEQISVKLIEPVGASGFTIVESDHTCRPSTLLSPDVATCEACSRELLHPRDRRYRYPFINCTECGPRYTIVRGLPYDRPATTMAGFDFCPDCRREYQNPNNRRFHAQPNACAVCGPQYVLLDASGTPVAADDIFVCAREAVETGAVVAIKGVGGWHLACSANNQAAVASLRWRKGREAKPFAVMAGSVDVVRQLCRVTKAEEAALTGRERPIVLLEKSDHYNLADLVAPGNDRLGVMLPYAPLHWLLLNSEDVWVMTSGNRAKDPIAYHEAQELRQSGLADFYLDHNRPIERPVEDSVITVFNAEPLFIRRSRGFAPVPLRLAKSQQKILAVGGDVKNAFCLMREGSCFISPQTGDLANQATYDEFCRLIDQYKRLFSVQPELIAHDLHPGYWSTRYSLANSLPHFGVQHHHAHIATVMVEHGLDESVIGVALDGTGYGEDGALWGGEFLLADLREFRRAAHFSYLPLPGGERAVREPWRMVAWLLREFYGEQAVTKQALLPESLPEGWQLAAALPAKKINSPLTSSVGRLFDAAGAILAGVYYNKYEGQAPIRLEQLAGKLKGQVWPYTIHEGKPLTIDFLPVFASMLESLQTCQPAALAASFHDTVAHAVYTMVCRLADTSGIRKVALGGGVWQNTRLLGSTVSLLSATGLQIYLPRQAPMNDGGICLGQAAIAAKAEIGEERACVLL